MIYSLWCWSGRVFSLHTFTLKEENEEKKKKEDQRWEKRMKLLFRRLNTVVLDCTELERGFNQKTTKPKHFVQYEDLRLTNKDQHILDTF